VHINLSVDITLVKRSAKHIMPSARLGEKGYMNSLRASQQQDFTKYTKNEGEAKEGLKSTKRRIHKEFVPVV
jgi:hypothetical protein